MSNNSFTIITVCYNAEDSIRNTMHSVLSQSFQDYEYIIKDGQSTDKTMEYIQSYTENLDCVKVIQGKDKGIYDAMNIAVREATGAYILFLNAGDTFANEDVLAKVHTFMANQEADIYYGDIIELDEKSTQLRTYSAKNSKLWYYSLGACLCHQAMFCKKELFERRLFDLDYLVCADREWQIWHIKKGAISIPMRIVVALIPMNGFSANHVADLERETRDCVKKYCGLWYGMYLCISHLKSNVFFRRIFRFCEKLLSCR